MSSDLCGKFEQDVEIKASPETVHYLLAKKPQMIPILTDKVLGVESQGDWGTVGSHIAWNYVHDGKARIAKHVLEAVDHEKHSITFKLIGGDLAELYKSLLIAIQATTKSDGSKGSVIHYTVEYEKHHGDVVDPIYFDKDFREFLKDLDQNSSP